MGELKERFISVYNNAVHRDGSDKSIDGSIQMSDYQKDDRRQMNKRGIAFIVVDIGAVVSKM